MTDECTTMRLDENPEVDEPDIDRRNDYDEHVLERGARWHYLEGA